MRLLHFLGFALPHGVLSGGALPESYGASPSQAPNSHQASVSCACNTLFEQAKGFVAQNQSSEVPFYISPTSPLYQSRVDAQWSNLCYQNASCIISPGTTEGVKSVMDTIRTCKTRFAVRSGGHNFNIGFSNVGPEGVLIDLVNMNRIALSKDKSEIEVGPGARWGDIYQHLNGSGVSVNGARAAPPAAGGSLLGGGFGYYMNAEGVSARGICAAEVVLSSGQVVQASDRSSYDLLWAIRGGGPNFGVVTKYTLRTVPEDRTWYLVRLYPESSIPALINAVANYTALAEKDQKSNIYVNLNPSSGSIVGFTNLGNMSRPPIFNEFYDIPYEVEPQPSAIGTEYTNTLAYTIPPSPPSRQYGTSVAVKSQYWVFKESYEAYEAIAKKLHALGGSLSLGMEIVNSNAAKKTAADTPMGLLAEAQTWYAVTLSWTDPTKDAVMFASIDELTHQLEEVAQKHKGLLKFKFPNDANLKEDVFSGYGAANVGRLRAIAAKYDRGQVFQRQQNGGFLLSGRT